MSIPLKTTEQNGVITQVILEDDGTLSERQNWQERRVYKDVTMHIGGQSFELESMTTKVTREKKRPYNPVPDGEAVELSGVVKTFDPTMN